MEKIVTVTGEIPGEELGFCQCHEHILLRKGQSYLVHKALWFDEPEKSRQELLAYRGAGGKSLVEAQPVGCGRMADGLFALSTETGGQIVASTGFHKLVFYPEDHWIYRWSREELAALYVSELTRGMYTDGDDGEPSHRISARAGQIKTALDKEGLTERYRRLFLAAADAAKATGAPMMIHVENGVDPRPLLYFLREAGIPGSQMIYCHMDRACSELAWHREIAEAGAYLEYDTIGRFKYHSDERELEIIRELVDAGFGGQLLFSLDTTRERLGAYGGSISLTYLLETFIPAMKACGISEEAIRMMAEKNSARALAWRVTENG